MRGPPTLRALLAVALAAALGAGEAPDGGGARSVFARALALNHLAEPELDDAAMTSAFADLVEACRRALAEAGTPAERVAALNRTILVERRTEYLSRQTWRDATMSAALLRRRCNCIGGSLLYVAVADALGEPVHLVIVPTHAFARWDDGVRRINIETTDGGREIADEEYLYRIGACDPADARALGWGASLDADRVEAHLLETAAHAALRDARPADALDLLGRASRLAPERTDLEFERLTTLAEMPGRRAEALAGIAALARRADAAPTIVASALLAQARDAALRRRYDREHACALQAFAVAPKSAQPAALIQLSMWARSCRESTAQVEYALQFASLTPMGSPQPAAAAWYDLALAHRENGDLAAAFADIRAGLAANPEAWYLSVLQAGYEVIEGRREQGLADYAAVQPPRDDGLMYACMRTWFAAVTADREAFYARLGEVLALDRSGYSLEWIDQDIDLDRYRDEAEFSTAVERHRRQILDEDAPATPAEPAAR